DDTYALIYSLGGSLPPPATSPPSSGPAPVPLPPLVRGGADPRTAGAGGIEAITQVITPLDQTAVVIEGRLREPLDRDAPTTPNFNRERFWGALRGEHNLTGWQAAHLWGPGFGDEAAEGMLLAPPEVNLVWQNANVERLLRRLFAES